MLFYVKHLHHNMVIHCEHSVSLRLMLAAFWWTSPFGRNRSIRAWRRMEFYLALRPFLHSLTSQENTSLKVSLVFWFHNKVLHVSLYADHLCQNMVSLCEHSVCLHLLWALSKAHGGLSVVEIHLLKETGPLEPGGDCGVLFSLRSISPQSNQPWEHFPQSIFNIPTIIIDSLHAPVCK